MSKADVRYVDELLLAGLPRVFLGAGRAAGSSGRPGCYRRLRRVSFRASVITYLLLSR